ncbi:rRNA methyltransferase 3, mitochondrial [Harmonia axyridis]|uniref:rRNA methyltransferase 3, mitochondrial n=1 Tax=Harmonia axyridis TaxID=115357 RepID=UPI001E275356|nr:rRNA methyltransferase 3, mitochondrial [Harmonia axyridis]
MFIIKQLVNGRIIQITNLQQLRYIPRWSSRTPKKVYMPEEINEIEKESKTYDERIIPDDKLDSIPNLSLETRNSKPKKKLPTLRKLKNKEEKQNDMLETIIDSDGNLVYTKMNNNDSRVARILSNLKSPKSLKKKESFLIEGKRLINEALKSGCKLEYILFSRKNELEEIKTDLPKLGAKIYKMPYREMELWSDLTTNPGIMGVFKIPELKETKYSLPVNIICDNIRDPGNLGSILRTCAAAGCKTIICTKGCCDIWNGKVLRGAMGAHFKIQIEKLEWKQIEKRISSTSWFIADNNLVKTFKNTSMIIDLINTIPIESYHLLKYKGSHEISLIIGGETEGISEEAYKIVHSKGGLRINIPLNNKVESLNSGTALGILLFEIKRQIDT